MNTQQNSLLILFFPIIQKSIEWQSLELPESSYHQVQDWLKEMFQQATLKAIELKINNLKIETAKYAIAAYLDEKIIQSQLNLRKKWLTNTFQNQLYEDSLAGENFYIKLDTLLQDPKSNKDVIEIYFLCMMLGFQGKYRLLDVQERQTKMIALQSILASYDKEEYVLSNVLIHKNENSFIGYTPQLDYEAIFRKKWIKSLWLLLILTFVLSVVYYIQMTLAIRGGIFE